MTYFFFEAGGLDACTASFFDPAFCSLLVLPAAFVTFPRKKFQLKFTFLALEAQHAATGLAPLILLICIVELLWDLFGRCRDL